MSAVKDAGKIIIQNIGILDYFDLVLVENGNILEKIRKHEHLFSINGRPYFFLSENEGVSHAVARYNIEKKMNGLLAFGQLNDLVRFLESEKKLMADENYTRIICAHRRKRFQDIVYPLDVSEYDLSALNVASTGHHDRTTHENLVDFVTGSGGRITSVEICDILLVGNIPDKMTVKKAERAGTQIMDIAGFVEFVTASFKRRQRRSSMRLAHSRARSVTA